MLPTPRTIPGVKHVLLVASGKGGVGKSTVAANLAHALLQRTGRHQVGLLDADIFGPSIPRLMGLEGTKIQSEASTNGRPIMLPALSNSGIKCMSMGFLVDQAAPIVWRGLMVMKAIEQLIWQVKWDPLEFLVVDMPPGTGDTQLTISQQIPISGALIVTTPQELALSDARRAVAMFQKVNVPVLGYVENMSGFKCPCCDKVTRIFPEGKKLENVPRLAEILLTPSIASNSESGCPSDHAAFSALADKIINRFS